MTPAELKIHHELTVMAQSLHLSGAELDAAARIGKAAWDRAFMMAMSAEAAGVTTDAYRLAQEALAMALQATVSTVKARASVADVIEKFEGPLRRDP